MKTKVPACFHFITSVIILIFFISGPVLASELSLRDNLTSYGLLNLIVTSSADSVIIKYTQTIAEFNNLTEMLNRIADIADMTTRELGGNYMVTIEQHFDDEQVMQISTQAKNGTAYLNDTLSNEQFRALLDFQPRTRGPVMVAGECLPKQGNTCENCPACSCYPGEICDPSNPAANERGCVVVTPPAHAHLKGSQYVCDDGYAWNGDLTNCIPIVKCPEHAFKFNGACECEAGYTWNSDKSNCLKIINLYYPHLACVDGWQTEICIINPSPDETLSGILKFFSNNGRPVGEDLTITLAPHARYQLTLNRNSPDAAELNYMVFAATSQNMCGYLKFFLNGKYRVAIPATFDKTSNDNLFVSHIASDKLWWTGISLLNTSSTSKKITFTFDNNQTKTVTLAGNEHRAFTIASLFDAEKQPGLNSAEISAAAGVVGLQIFGGGDQLSGILLKDNTATELYYPHLVSDDSWWTGIAAYNPHATSSTLTITPFSKDGESLTTQTFNLGSHKKYLGTLSSLNLPANSAWFKVESTLGITGFELFGTNNGKLLAGYTGVGIASRNAIFPKLEKNGWTGIAFANISNKPANITLKFYNDAGVAVADGTIQVNSHSKVLGQAENLLRLDTSGATYMDYSSDQDVVGFQIDGSTDNMMLDALPGM
jgi:hypothetical protein